MSFRQRGRTYFSFSTIQTSFGIVSTSKYVLPRLLNENCQRWDNWVLLSSAWCLYTNPYRTVWTATFIVAVLIECRETRMLHKGYRQADTAIIMQDISILSSLERLKPSWHFPWYTLESCCLCITYFPCITPMHMVYAIAIKGNFLKWIISVECL